MATAAFSGTVLVQPTLVVSSLKVFVSPLPKRRSMVICSAKGCTWPTLHPSRRYTVTPIRQAIRVCFCCAKPSSESQCRNSYMPPAMRGTPQSRTVCFRPGEKAAQGPRPGKTRLVYTRILKESRWYVPSYLQSGYPSNSVPDHYLFSLLIVFDANNFPSLRMNQPDTSQPPGDTHVQDGHLQYNVSTYSSFVTSSLLPLASQFHLFIQFTFFNELNPQSI